MNSETLAHIHWLHVLVAGLAYFMLGAIWYSKLLFAPAWLKYTGIDVNDPNATKGAAAAFGGSLVLMLISSFAMALLVYKLETCGIVNGLKLGALVGFCFGSSAISVSYLYEKRPFQLHLINGGYTVLGNMIAGAILATWH